MCAARYPPTALSPCARYEMVAKAFGGKGYLVTQPKELLPALTEATAAKVSNTPGGNVLPASTCCDCVCVVVWTWMWVRVWVWG